MMDTILTILAIIAILAVALLFGSFAQFLSVVDHEEKKFWEGYRKNEAQVKGGEP